MADKNKIGNLPDATPGSGGLRCEEWEALLADALDGLLPAGDTVAFHAHSANCMGCADLLAHAKQGQAWLEYLHTEPEVPAGLVAKILDKTAGAGAIPVQVIAGAGTGVGVRSESGGNSVAAQLSGNAAADDRGHGVLLDCAHAQHGGSETDEYAPGGPAAVQPRSHDLSTVLGGAGIRGAFLLKNEVCVPTGIEDAGAAAGYADAAGNAEEAVSLKPERWGGADDRAESAKRREQRSAYRVQRTGCVQKKQKTLQQQLMK